MTTVGDQKNEILRVDKIIFFRIETFDGLSQ